MPNKINFFQKYQKVLIASGFTVLILTIGLLLSLLIAGKKQSLSQSINPPVKPGIMVGEVEKIPLPKTETLAQYFQTEYADLNQDQTKEAIALYYAKPDEADIYKTFFVIYSLQNNSWQKLIDQELEAFTLFDVNTIPLERAKEVSQFSLVNLRNDLTDILVTTLSEGSGQYFGFFVFGWQDNTLKKLFVQGPIPHGQTGIEDKTIWLLSPIYGPNDPNCCPSQWQKNWFSWKDEQFELVDTLINTTLESVKEVNFSLSQKESIKESSTAPSQTGTIEGSLSYPSEGIPDDMQICAENLITSQKYCTFEQLKNSKYLHGYGYQIDAPQGNYYVWAQTSALSGYKAYYSEFVTCGLNYDCPSHSPITVTVNSGQTTPQIDPGDWYFNK